MFDIDNPVTHGHTAAEVIYERADATKPFMGLTSPQLKKLILNQSPL